MATDPTKLVFDDLPVPSPGTVRLTFGDDSPEPDRGVRLAFGQPAVSSPGVVRLVFGSTDDGPAPSVPDVTLHATGRITGLRLHITARTGLQLVGSGRITGMRLRIVAAYKINAARPMVARTNAVWQVADPRQSGLQDRAQDTIAAPSGTTQHWQPAIRTPSGAAVLVQNTLRAPLDNRSIYNSATRAMQDARTLYSNARRDVRNLVREAFANAQRGQTPPLTLRHQDNLRDRRPWRTTGWQGGQRQGLPHTSGQGPALWLNKPFDCDYENAMRPPPGIYVPSPVVPPPDPCYLPTLPVRLVFGEMAGSSLPARLVFVCERHGSGPGPQPGEIIVVPVRRTYIVINSITLHRVDTGAELHAHSFSMSLDYQSWTWSWNASLHSDAAPHLGRDSAGDPPELAVFVNGVEFRLRLERKTRDRRFSPTRWAVSGRGKASVLGSDDAPRQSFRNTADRTAQQLMADVLTVNGVPMGWTIDWGLDDWLVPAGAWAIQGNYIDAINDIAGAAGGYVQPHNTAATLRVLPRYPLAPWEWGSVTSYVQIPDDAAEVEGTEYIDKPAYNRVFVGGIGAGVFGPFTRAGTAGNVIAPPVNHALITHPDVHRQRGIAELSDTGRQEIITLNMQVLPETGVIVPGQFVRYQGESTVMGIVRSTAIDWSRPRLRQTLEVETHA